MQKALNRIIFNYLSSWSLRQIILSLMPFWKSLHVKDSIDMSQYIMIYYHVKCLQSLLQNHWAVHVYFSEQL